MIRTRCRLYRKGGEVCFSYRYLGIDEDDDGNISASFNINSYKKAINDLEAKGRGEVKEGNQKLCLTYSPDNEVWFNLKGDIDGISSCPHETRYTFPLSKLKQILDDEEVILIKK